MVKWSGNEKVGLLDCFECTAAPRLQRGIKESNLKRDLRKHQVMMVL